MSTDHISALLIELEQELQHLSMWESIPPSVDALASTEPFCIDTLALNQWLQWIFIPRLRALIEGGLPLPLNCSILPIAEEFCSQQSDDCAKLLIIVTKIDQYLS
ncbi:YqcC family protein [Endozoicomonas sp. SM1973]|uniref:YqcC family protein n=1 Tax=Spartinivicinus marinus TaxID=2994442 RepID=A0A853IFJ1_9GAMM|nr:YqcC family protein [Spartinivicinus marinus]MCX4026325.1 YqcC family protein [Spartinivicinus marinus]NYZ69308.1 YqcC family protein [Spartinivicinus marinus]